MTSLSTNPLGLKLMIVGRRRPGTTLAEHRHHIRHVHGEIVLRYIASDPENAPRRYVQHQVIDGQYRGTPVAADPFALNRDFVTQIWMPDFAALTRSRETTFYRDQLQGDEDNFVDQATVVFMPLREREVLCRAAPGAGACKLFVFHQKTAETSAERFAEAWGQGADMLSRGPLAASVSRYVQNDALPRPGPPATVDAIDEFWLDDEASARALLTQWQAWAQEVLVGSGLATGSGLFALLATEAVLHAGPR